MAKPKKLSPEVRERAVRLVLEQQREVPEAERTCPCGTPMVVIGEEINEQLDIVPMKVQLLRHIRRRYGCPGGALFDRDLIHTDETTEQVLKEAGRARCWASAPMRCSPSRNMASTRSRHWE